ncbi:FUSC family protein [Bacillus sp. FJAT-27986]|uniref:FUSC family protein n=1 Tax=Bacillus sp. FJAT-27986 TaxID=1743146 RepID=UPI00080ADF2F|nr:aromatic acid exporter family protein [Bacillus sp. FJAT-27986]OCA82481.1 hypothetical protein A8L44_12800 [Bacillus sp. FJAT-27986]
MKVGARVFKTGIAIVIAIYVATAFNVPAPVLAGISAVFAVQPTIYRSYRTLIDQIQANIIGFLIAISFVLLFGNDPLLIGLAAIITIVINLQLKNENQLTISLVTLILIMEQQDGNFTEFAFWRVAAILIGILSAFIVNLVFLPPKYETKLYKRISTTTDDILQWIRIGSRSSTEHIMMKKDINRIKENVTKADSLYALYKEERETFRKNTVAKSRKLVIYRYMIATNKRSLDILKRLHRFENEFHQMPEDFQIQVHHQLDLLLRKHEHIHLKFIGKVKPGLMLEESTDTYNKQLLIDIVKGFRLNTDEDSPVHYHMVTLISSMLEYGDYLEHLEMLVNSFHSYHKSENKSIKINDDDQL